jgi:hypothetical protein
MNYAKTVFKLREQIIKFSGELHKSLPIDKKTWNMVYIMTEIARIPKTSLFSLKLRGLQYKSTLFISSSIRRKRQGQVAKLAYALGLGPSS